MLFLSSFRQFTTMNRQLLPMSSRLWLVLCGDGHVVASRFRVLDSPIPSGVSAVGELEAYYNIKRNMDAYKRGERPSE